MKNFKVMMVYTSDVIQVVKKCSMECSDLEGETQKQVTGTLSLSLSVSICSY